MESTWADLEKRVRQMAEHIWERPAAPERIGGVNIDCVLKVAEDLWVLIEVTEERNVNKVREDVTKLVTAKNTLFQSQGIFARCFCVVASESVTPSMLEAGSAHKIKVMSAHRFERIFFDFDAYRHARSKRHFGSAVNPITGERDNSTYVPVKYVRSGPDEEVDVEAIAEWLIRGKRVVMLGEYGSGKSRCVRELFEALSNRADESARYPIAIDLRENWGLRRAPELVRRHFEDLGIEKAGGSALKAMDSDALVFLLDGFDEIGSQAWSDDSDKLRAIRAQSLEGVKDLARSSRGGILVCGREHYFNNNEEMFSALGLDARETIILRSKDEFTDDEMQEYFEQIGDSFTLPSWLPRRPLICQTIASLSDDEMARMFSEEGGDVEFWGVFIRILCERDARIHPSFDAETLHGVLTYLSRLTRTKSANVGPLTMGEIQRASKRLLVSYRSNTQQ